MESNKIDQLFKNKLDRHSLEVSDQAWAQIKSQIKPKKKNKPKFWMVAASAGILVMFSLGLGYNILQEPVNVAETKIDLKSEHNFSEQSGFPALPQIIEKEEAKPKRLVKTENKEKIYASAKETSSEEKANEQISVPTFDRVSAKEASIAINLEMTGTLRLPAAKKDSEIIVEMYYDQRIATSSKNSLNKSANKLKSLAGEISLADLRSAKNELFASAFQAKQKSN